MQVKYAIMTEQGGWSHPTRKSKIWPHLVREFGKSGQIYIKVSYGKDLYNHTTVKSYKEAKEFVNSCTEPELLKYMENWK